MTAVDKLFSCSDAFSSDKRHYPLIYSGGCNVLCLHITLTNWAMSIFSLIMHSRSDVCYSLMWLWRVKIPSEDFSDVKIHQRQWKSAIYSLWLHRIKSFFKIYQQATVVSKHIFLALESLDFLQGGLEIKVFQPVHNICMASMLINLSCFEVRALEGWCWMTVNGKSLGRRDWNLFQVYQRCAQASACRLAEPIKSKKFRSL